MSCIRLHAITIDSNDSSLIIENGNVNVTDTTISTSALNGCLVLDGGLGINCTVDSISSTSGSALSVGGGASIVGKTYLGSDLTLDSTLSTFVVKGITYPRFILDTINNKRLEVSLDGLNKHFVLNNSSLSINVTASSTSQSSGALVVNGGVSINCTANSTSVTHGGSLTVGGGMSVGDDLYIGDSVFISGNAYVNDIVSGIGNNLNISTGDINNDLNITSGYVVITTNGLIIKNTSGNDNVIFNTTSSSFNNAVYLNNTSGSGIESNSLVASGSVSFNSTNNSTSATSGGCLTIAGGVGINKDLRLGGALYTNDNIHLLNNNSTLGSFSVISNGSLLFNCSNTFRFNNADMLISKGSLQLNEYMLTSTNGNLNIQSLSTDSYINLYTTYNDGLDDNLIYLYGYNANSNADREYLKLGYISSSQSFNVSVEGSGAGNIRDFVLQNTNGSVTLNTSGSVILSNTTMSSNSTTGSLLLNGGLSINSTTNATSVTCGGGLTIAGGASLQKDFYLGGEMYLNGNGTTGNLNIPSKLNIYNSEAPSIVVAKRNASNTLGNLIDMSFYTLGTSPSDTSYENLQISGSSGPFGGFNVNTNASGSGIVHYLNLYTGTSSNQLFLATSGNVGINSNNPGYKLDVNGDINSNSTIRSLNLNVTNGTCNNLFVTNNTTITNDLTVNGNTACYKTVNFYNTSNAVSSNDGGCVTIVGGLGVGKDVYINGCISSNSHGSFNTVSITSTSGSCLSLTGGLTINSTVNSSSNVNGGSLTVLGGASIKSDFYIGGSSYLSDSLNITNNTNGNDLLNIYDSFNISRFGLNYNSGVLSLNRRNNSGVIVENIVSYDNTNGYTTFNNTTPSLNTSTSSVIVSGGLNINCTINSSNISIGGALTIAGGTSIKKDLFIGGDIHIESTTASNNINTGSIIVKGGVGISSDLHVGGNTIVTGNLIVNGTTTSVDATNAVISDNIMVLNSGPTGSHDSGVLISRYQVGNDSGSGDVVNDNPYIVDILPNQSGISSPSNHIKLSNLTSSIDDYYSNWWIKIESGFSTNQCRQIVSYNGTTHVATLDSAWTTQNPASGDIVYLYNKPFVGIIYNELLNVFQFGSTTQDPGKTNVSFTDSVGISFGTGYSSSTTPSTSISSGGLTLSGGLGINCTVNSTSSTNGGGLTIAGGAAINKSVYIGESLYVNNVNTTPNSYDIISSITYNALNNQLDIPFITINSSVWSFDIYLAVVIVMANSNDNLYCNFHIRGVNKSDAWEIVSSYVGDDTGIEFDIVNDIITSNGLVRYSTPDYGIDISSITFKYRMITN